MKTASPDLAHVAGLILAGGRSSRFGADKALARFRGELLLDRARRPLQDLPIVAISAKQASTVAVYARERGATLVADASESPDGPLAGVLAGLDWAAASGFAFLATVPCDAPILPHDLVPTLLAKCDGAPAAYAQTIHGPHPLCAVWSTALAASLRSALAAGNHPAVRQFQTGIGAAPVSFEAASAFANANTRDILSALEQCL